MCRIVLCGKDENKQKDAGIATFKQKHYWKIFSSYMLLSKEREKWKRYSIWFSPLYLHCFIAPTYFRQTYYFCYCPLSASLVLSLSPTGNKLCQNRATTAQWIRLCQSSCGPGLESQAQSLCLALFTLNLNSNVKRTQSFCLWNVVVKRTKSLQIEAGIGPYFFKKKLLPYGSYVTENSPRLLYLSREYTW